MKIVFNKRIVNGPWGGGNQILQLFQGHLIRKGHKISYSLDDDVNVVVIMDVKEDSCSFPMDQLDNFKQRKGIKIIHRINDNGSHRKNNTERNDNLMIDVNKRLADKTIFISHWLKEYYKNKGMEMKQECVIPNGVDRSIFYPNINAIIRKKEEPLKIVTHHWSSNMSKGFDIYDKLAVFCEKFPKIASFRYIGNYPSGMLNNCDKIVPQLYGVIPKYLIDQDLYITATQCESGGCHIIEGMSCGLIPLVKIGGGGPEEYSRGYAKYYNDYEELEHHILLLYNDYDMFFSMRNNIRENYTYRSIDMCNSYMRVINDT